MNTNFLRSILLGAIFFAGGALIGCAASALPTQPAPFTKVFTAPPSPIQYARSGGIIGLRDELTIDPKGHAVLSRRNGKFEFDLNSASLKELYDALETARFASIPENSMPLGIVADGFSYTITFQNHTVKTGDAAIPKALEPVIAALNKIVDTQGK